MNDFQLCNPSAREFNTLFLLVLGQRFGYISPMQFVSLKRLGLVLGACLALTAPAIAQETGVDNKSAVIFAYFAIGRDDNPSVSLRVSQFAAQIDELANGEYTVKPLPDIIDAFTTGKNLPERTIAITFDGADRSVLEYAAPLLEKHKFPYTVFIPADRVTSGKPPFMGWDDLRRLKKSGLVSFGLHPSSYGRLTQSDAETIKRQLNGSLATIREELGTSPTLFSYPFGEHDEFYEKIVKEMGFKAGFAQQSGVAYAGQHMWSLPRFTITERYADMDRFIMTANALPLAASDITPNDPYLSTLTPSIGFTVSNELTKSLKSLSCFSSGDEKPELEILNARVEIRMNRPLDEPRLRINCTLPVTAKAGEETRVRWLGMMYTVPPALLGSNEDTTAKPADDNPDYINIE